MGLEVRCVDHQKVGFAAPIGQFEEHPREDALIAPVARQGMRGMPERGRFQRLQSVFGGPFSGGASRQRNPLRLRKIIPERPRRPSTRACSPGEFFLT